MHITKRYAFLMAMVMLHTASTAWSMENPVHGMTNPTQLEANLNSALDSNEPGDAYEIKLEHLLNNEKNVEENLKNGFPTPFNHFAGYIQQFGQNNPEKIKAEIEYFAERTRPIIPSVAYNRGKEFLTNNKNNPFYHNMTIEDFFIRLYTARPLVYFEKFGRTILPQEPKKLHPYANDKLDVIGTTEQAEPFTLANLLSLEERDISALLGMASDTPFINNGNWMHKGKLTDDPYQPAGVMIGVVGPCYERANIADCLSLIKKENQQNGDIQITNDNIYKPGDRLTQRERDLTKNLYFRPTVYKDRIRIPIESFLEEANRRGKEQKKMVHARVCGLGLGAWKLFEDNTQLQLMFEVYKDILDQNEFNNISDIEFIRMDKSVADKINLTSTSFKKNENIKLHFSQSNYADKLNDESKLLVVMYAWDGFAGPGNEYLWPAGENGVSNPLSASGDPAAICCSLVLPLQSPFINPFILPNIRDVLKELQRLEQPKENTAVPRKNPLAQEQANAVEKTKTQEPEVAKIVAAARIAQERAEAERIAAQEKAEAERIAAQEKAEAERIAAQEKAEAERLAAQEKAEAERIAQERADAARIAQERADAARIAQERADAARIAQERADAARIAQERADAARIAQERAAADKLLEKDLQNKSKTSISNRGKAVGIITISLLGLGTAYYFATPEQRSNFFSALMKYMDISWMWRSNPTPAPSI